MMELKFFLKDNVAKRENQKVIISDRFKDDNGEMLPFEIKAITSHRDTELRKAHTIQKEMKKGVFQPSLDSTTYMKALAIECVVHPNLNDKDVQDSYGVMSAGQLLDEMLLPGEYNELLEQIQKINGWDVPIVEKKEQVKN